MQLQPEWGAILDWKIWNKVLIRISDVTYVKFHLNKISIKFYLMFRRSFEILKLFKFQQNFDWNFIKISMKYTKFQWNFNEVSCLLKLLWNFTWNFIETLAKFRISFNWSLIESFNWNFKTIVVGWTKYSSPLLLLILRYINYYPQIHSSMKSCPH